MSRIREGVPASTGTVALKTRPIPPTVAEPAANCVEIGVLGPLDVRNAGETIHVRRGLPRVLLCSLVLQRRATVSTDTLIDHLWGQVLPAHPANALQTQIAYLRQALGGIEAAPIVTRPGGYALDVPAERIDVHRFETHRLEAERLVGIATLESLTDALDEYCRALELWRGPAFFDVIDHDFADIETIRLEELRLLTHEAMTATLIALGRASDAVAELGGLVSAHPLRERLQELLILGLYRTGRQSEALRSYATARNVLAEELGVEPGLRLKELEQQVLMQDPRLEWTPPPRAAGATPAAFEAAAKPLSTRTSDLRATTTGPASSFDLIGRERELERVVSLLSDCRLLTLTGPGGAGKTRLALEVARSWAPIRTTVVDLAAATEATVAATLLTALGAGASVDADPVAAIGATLGDDECLLVVDTCERVVGGLAPIIEGLLAARPNITILATSRRPLNVAGEIAWPIPPLVVPTQGQEPESSPAFELFVRRAREVEPDLDLSDEDVMIIAELCRTLEGLPLAIELAAAQMDVLSPATIQDHLAEVAVPASSFRPERQRTMRATTEWSIGLLDECERDLLYRLSVFAPNFDLDAALAVGDGDRPRTLVSFVALVRNSLVTHESGDRYRLPEAVRAHLQAGDDRSASRADAKRRHAERYAALAAQAYDEVRTPSQGPWMTRLDADLANIRLAIDWCFGPDGDEQLGARIVGDIAWVWTLQGNLVDSRRALDRAGAVDAPPEVRSRVLLGIGLVNAPLGDHERVRQVCEESAEIGRTLHDDRAVAAALLSLGVAEWAAGDLRSAASTHDEALALFQSLGDPWGGTVCRILRARTARDLGELELMEALLDTAVDDAKRTGDQHVIGLANEQSAWLCLTRNDLERADMWARACLDSNETLGYPEGICAALTLIGRIQLANDEPEDARSSYLRMLELGSAIGHLGAMCAALEGIAEVDARCGDHRHAALLLLTAERARRNLPLSAIEADRIGDLRRQVHDELGTIWGDTETEVRLGSLDALISSLLNAV